MSAAHFGRRMLSHVAASTRAAGQSSMSSVRMGMRRGMASAAHGAKEAAKNDLPWLVGLFLRSNFCLT